MPNEDNVLISDEIQIQLSSLGVDNSASKEALHDFRKALLLVYCTELIKAIDNGEFVCQNKMSRKICLSLIQDDLISTVPAS